VRDTGPDLESRLVWQFGSPRSGSTWLLQMLGEHPRIMPINEPLIGFHLSPFLANDPGYHAEDLDLETFTIRRAMGDDPERFFAESFADVWVPGLRRLLNERFGAHLARFAQSPPDETTIVIKEPNGSQSADVIMRAQPRARLLFLVRDGRDVVDSTLASLLVGAWGQKAHRSMRGVSESERLDVVTRLAYQWLWQTEVVEVAFAAHRGPKHMLRYEDLLREPERHVGELFEWLTLPLEQAEVAALVKRFAFENLSGRGPDRFHRSATPGAWRENLHPSEQAALQEVLGVKLRELGYETEAHAPAGGTSGGLTPARRVRRASAGAWLARMRSASRGGATPASPEGGAKPVRESAQSQPKEPHPGKAQAIDWAVEQLGIESFLSLEFDGVLGEWAFYAIDRPTVQHGALVDARARRSRAHLLSAVELAAEYPGMRVLDRAFADQSTVSEIGEVDAILMFDVLHHMVDPDWDQLLELYAPITSSFVIANPQWERSETTVRLIDLGREQYLEAVPPTGSHTELFDRLDDMHKGQQRLFRDATHVWQWGITDADLKSKLGELGFSVQREWEVGRLPRANGFVNKAFVFSRSDRPAGGGT
jgi:sulfotransferase family protein